MSATITCPLNFSPTNDKTLEFTNFAAALIHRLQRYPQKIALICPYTDRRFTGLEIIRLIETVARNLAKGGLRKGDIVVFHALTTPFSMVVIAGIILSGGTYAGLSRHGTMYELDYVLKDTGSKFLILSRKFLEDAKNLDLADKRILSFPEDLDGDFLDLLARDIDENSALNLLRPCPSDIVLPTTTGRDTGFLPYSSGTTGTPKGVLLSNSMLIQAIFGPVCRTGMCYAEGNIVVNVSPLNHPAGFNFVFNAMGHGATTVMLKAFNPLEYATFLAKYRCDHVMAVPSLLVALVKEPRLRSMDLSSVRQIFFGSSTCGMNVIRQLKELFPNLESMKQIYGMTEIGLICTTPNVPLGHFPLDSIGVPCPGVTMKVVNPQTLEPLGPLATGELWVHTPSTTMTGYWRSEQKTRDTIVHGGWVRTGDIGYYDGAGRFYITDRLKELIKYKSYQIAPAELENLLIRHPSIAEAGVTGVPAPVPEDGELPAAFVVLQEGMKPSPELASEIAASVNQQVASYKRLRGGVHFVKELAKTPSGKVMRRVLKSKL